MKALFDLIFIIPPIMLIAYVMMDIIKKNPDVDHTRKFKTRRAFNWLPLGLTYAFLYMGRYNLTVSKNALGDLMTKEDFGIIFAAGTITYAISFLINGPLTDRIGGKKAIIIGATGAAIANILMGFLLYGIRAKGMALNLTLSFSILYSLNMYFQSFGAVAIVKVNAAWFHVRERGVFGGIFGILISLGIYFAFDWGFAIVNATRATAGDLGFVQEMLRSVLGVAGSSVDQVWWVFFIPAAILAVFVILDIFIIRDTPGQAGFKDFYTADASAGEEDKPFKLKEILKKIITNKIILTIALIEFCTGVLRNGVMHWYPIYTKELMTLEKYALMKANWAGVLNFMSSNWGGVLMLAGVFGGMTAGIMSDKIFKSRRGPVAAVLYGMMFFATLLMVFVIETNQIFLAIAVVAMSFCVIGTHGMLSGTSTMDFGGKRAAATAVVLIDGFVYLGTGIQSIFLGYITTSDWGMWPIFLIPFTVIGFLLALKIWKAIPKPSAAK